MASSTLGSVGSATVEILGDIAPLQAALATGKANIQNFAKEVNSGGKLAPFKSVIQELKELSASSKQIRQDFKNAQVSSAAFELSNSNLSSSLDVLFEKIHAAATESQKLGASEESANLARSRSLDMLHSLENKVTANRKILRDKDSSETAKAFKEKQRIAEESSQRLLDYSKRESKSRSEAAKELERIAKNNASKISSAYKESEIESGKTEKDSIKEKQRLADEASKRMMEGYARQNKARKDTEEEAARIVENNSKKMLQAEKTSAKERVRTAKESAKEEKRVRIAAFEEITNKIVDLERKTAIAERKFTSGSTPTKEFAKQTQELKIASSRLYKPLEDAALAARDLGVSSEFADKKLGDLKFRLDKINAGMHNVANTTKNRLGQGMLQAAYAIDDLQYGFRAIVNNIPGVVMSLGGGAGVAGALGILAVATNLAINNWDKLIETGFRWENISDAIGKKFKEVGDGIAHMFDRQVNIKSKLEELEETVKKLTDKKHKVVFELDLLDQATKKLEEFKSAVDEYKSLVNKPSSLQEARGKIIKEGLDEESDEERTGAEKLEDSIRRYLTAHPEEMKDEEKYVEKKKKADETEKKLRGTQEAYRQANEEAGADIYSDKFIESKTKQIKEDLDFQRKEESEQLKLSTKNRSEFLAGSLAKGSAASLAEVRAMTDAEPGVFKENLSPDFIKSLGQAGAAAKKFKEDKAIEKEKKKNKPIVKEFEDKYKEAFQDVPMMIHRDVPRAEIVKTIEGRLAASGVNPKSVPIMAQLAFKQESDQYTAAVAKDKTAAGMGGTPGEVDKVVFGPIAKDVKSLDKITDMIPGMIAKGLTKETIESVVGGLISNTGISKANAGPLAARAFLRGQAKLNAAKDADNLAMFSGKKATKVQSLLGNPGAKADRELKHDISALNRQYGKNLGRKIALEQEKSARNKESNDRLKRQISGKDKTQKRIAENVLRKQHGFLPELSADDIRRNLTGELAAGLEGEPGVDKGTESAIASGIYDRAFGDLEHGKKAKSLGGLKPTKQVKPHHVKTKNTPARFGKPGKAPAVPHAPAMNVSMLDKLNKEVMKTNKLLRDVVANTGKNTVGVAAFV